MALFEIRGLLEVWGLAHVCGRKPVALLGSSMSFGAALSWWSLYIVY